MSGLVGFRWHRNAAGPVAPSRAAVCRKIHAHTLPRNTANSRVKDLMDVALLIASGGLDRERTLDALRLIFERRETHDLPTGLIPPPAEWQIPFRSWRENVSSRPMSPQCLRTYRSISKKC
ncbi:MAG: nucleotidyl transferase AbiEii/AbiGii toxin family protein [Acidobacteriaceae bacterium]